MLYQGEETASKLAGYTKTTLMATSIKNLSNIRWIFFDVGYTLLDETPAWHERFVAMSAELGRRGRTVTTSQIWQTFNAICERFAPLQWLGLCDELAASREEAKALAALAGGWRHDLQTVYPGTAEMLARLHGRFKLGVIANQSEGTAARLAERNLGQYFDLVIGSAEAGVRKPDPKIFRMALDQAGCAAAEAVMVGDRIDNDIRPANLIGMQTIHVRQGGSGRQRARSVDETPTVSVDHISEVPPVFGGDHE